MTRRSIFRSVLLTAVLVLAGCAALPAQAPLKLWSGYADHPAGYVAKGSGPDAAEYLPPPPDGASAAGLADADTVAATRRLEGSPRWSLAAQDAEVFAPDSALKTFACALDAQIAPASTPRLTLLLGRIPADVDTIQESAKRLYARKRPFVVTPAPICVKPDSWLAASGSYPSGHAATGWAWALVLSQLAPDRAGPILRRGQAFGDSRVVCGVHFPTDVAAGRQSGAALIAWLQADPRFQADLAAARKELAAARTTAASPNCASERAALETRTP